MKLNLLISLNSTVPIKPKSTISAFFKINKTDK